MSIYFNKDTREFHLQGMNVSYIFNILKNNHLGHIYFGKKINHRESFSHLVQYQTERLPLTTCVFEGDNFFSLETIKQEYPSFGNSDFRDPAFQILQDNGSRITNFEYVSHEIYSGKTKLQGLPATYSLNDQEVTTLEILMEDRLINIQIKLTYSLFEEIDAITRSVLFINKSNKNIALLRALSICVDFPDADFELLHLSGTWGKERHIIERELVHGIQSVSSARGASSAHHNPFIALKRKNVTENAGEIFGFNLVYSGNFLAQVEVDHYDVSRVLMGINPFDFKWILEPGEQFQTPEAVMVYSDQGLNGMSQIFHELYRTRLIRGKWKDKPRPILINNWEATQFDFDEKYIQELVEPAKEAGIELFVLDDGWFDRRNDDTSSLGDWTPDKNKLPDGIKGVADKINKKGLKFGLWFEPEMINKKSNLYKKHPDWLIHVPDRNPCHGRNQYILDFSREEVVEYIYKSISEILKDSSVSYVKWDMNRNMTDIGSANLPPERQQEVPHRYILGLYSLLERLTNEFPDILFESCASGGGRFDPGMLYYMPQTWTSDDTDAVERLKIQYGTSLVYPLNSMGAHVTAVPNHQVKRITSLSMRAEVAYFGCFGYELDLNKLAREEIEEIKGQIDFYKKYRELFQFGSFYRLLSPFEGNRTAWMVVSRDKKNAIVGNYRVLSLPNQGFESLKLAGLEPEYKYEISGSNPYYMYGSELMNKGICLKQSFSGGEFNNHDKSEDFKSEIFILKVN